MNGQNKAYAEKVRTELLEAKARIFELEARSKAEDKQVVMDLITQLKRIHCELEKQREKLETSAIEEIEEEKVVIDAEIVRLRAGLAQADEKLNEEPRTN